ncbi:transcription factor bHLH18-like [Lotus japonicus]|uniref:transcription factor bHLH18-like n=1 Tax=Lotus japonicus TaxID=34305 RepID=UPI002589662A|nr:transcription factor bHLH18-like [Lotus japonicus]
MMSPSEEESWTSWLCDLELEDCDFLNEPDTIWLDESFLSEDPTPLQELNLQTSFSNDSNHSFSSGDDENSFEKPSKALKTADTANFPLQNGASPFYILSFNNENEAPILNFDSTLKSKDNAVNVNVNQHENRSNFPSKRSLNCQKKEPKRKVHERERVRSPHQAHDHIMAERKRREKISQQFIALSVLIPGLKKIDKASVLGDAIQYMKQLQEQVKLQEEQIKRKSAESVVYVEKSESSVVDDDVSNTSSNSGTANNNVSQPEVEARVSENKVLIRIHCDKQEGVLMNILKEIDNLHLSVINSSALLFGTSKLDITIIAEMDEEFRMSVKELARKLRVELLQFMLHSFS